MGNEVATGAFGDFDALHQILHDILVDLMQRNPERVRLWLDNPHVFRQALLDLFRPAENKPDYISEYMARKGESITSLIGGRKASGEKPPTPDDELKGRPIGRVLTKMGLITRDQVVEALDVQKKLPRDATKMLGEILVGLGYVSAENVEKALVAQGYKKPD